MNNARVLYLIGSLRNPRIPAIASLIRETNPTINGEPLEVFDDWYAAGEEADDYWKSYEINRGRSYQAALDGYAARHVFDFDKHHLDRCTDALLVLPAGKSGHMELMYAAYGVGANTAILLEPDFDGRFDVMYRFINRILENEGEINEWLTRGTAPAVPEIVEVESETPTYFRHRL